MGIPCYWIRKRNAGLFVLQHHKNKNRREVNDRREEQSSRRRFDLWRVSLALQQAKIVPSIKAPAE
jgi:hypothetical protein